MFKVNISTIITWKRRYEATNDVKIKIRCPVNKKIIPEEFTEHIEAHPDAYFKEIAEVFSFHPASVQKQLRKLWLREKKEYILQRTSSQTRRGIFRKNQRHFQRKARLYR